MARRKKSTSDAAPEESEESQQEDIPPAVEAPQVVDAQSAEAVEEGDAADSKTESDYDTEDESKSKVESNAGEQDSNSDAEPDSNADSVSASDSESENSAEDQDPEPDSEQRLRDAADTVVKICMQMRPHENVLIVTDPETAQIGQALYEASSRVADRVLLVMMPPTQQHGEEPPIPVGELMRKQHVVLAPTRYSLTHTRARLAATREGARIATMPGVTLDMFTEGGMTADFDLIRTSIAKLGTSLRKRKNVRVTNAAGTDVTFEIDPRKWNREDSGICNRPGLVTNLPAGKVFILPKEETINGTIVIDGSWDSTLLDEPLVMEVQDGLVISVEGGELAEQVKQQYSKAAAKLATKDAKKVWTVAEFGFGMNPSARLIGNVLEDEKVLGCAYFAIGDNSTIGGRVRAGIHITGVIRDPTVELDELILLEAGALIDKK